MPSAHNMERYVHDAHLLRTTRKFAENAPSLRGAYAKEKPTSIIVLQSTEKWGVKDWGTFVL